VVAVLTCARLEAATILGLPLPAYWLALLAFRSALLLTMFWRPDACEGTWEPCFLALRTLDVANILVTSEAHLDAVLASATLARRCSF
jgi:hypothetical protein